MAGSQSDGLALPASSFLLSDPPWGRVKKQSRNSPQQSRKQTSRPPRFVVPPQRPSLGEGEKTGEEFTTIDGSMAVGERTVAIVAVRSGC